MISFFALVTFTHTDWFISGLQLKDLIDQAESDVILNYLFDVYEKVNTRLRHPEIKGARLLI
jgi:hypothetical protein